MLRNATKYLFFILIATLASCAKRGSITGGLKDTIAPTLKNSFPNNYSTNFNSKEIKLVFDEYIKLKNVNKQLVISPPLKYEPLITPLTATKYLSIKIKDTLAPNTTYSFNFGQSIADNNEGNPLNQFKYVFSTGNYIDSLSIGGHVKNSLEKETDAFVSVLLYEVNDKFNDSVIYKKPPSYITNTLDSLKTFKLENLKAGKYLLIALKDLNGNNKFDPQKDKVGFLKNYISVPTDTLYELELFQENLPFKSLKPTQASANKLLLGYEGEMNTVTNRPTVLLKNKNKIVETIVTKFPQKDSLQVWFKPIKVDSLALSIKIDKYDKEFTVKLRDQKKDTLFISPKYNGTLNFRDRYYLTSSTPLVKFDNSKIKLINKDSVSVDFKTIYDEFNQEWFFDFDKEASQKYTLSLLPGATTDFYGITNDSLTFRATTRQLDEYGNLSVNLQNVKRFPIIVQVTDEKGEVIASEYTDSKTKVEFNLLEPNTFNLRVIYDDNKNKKWDTGNYLEKLHPEEVIYFSKTIRDVRANWDDVEFFDLSIPYTPEVKKKEIPKKNNRSSF
ncbi:Ig-like domain-containing protein [Flavobacterium sp. F-380]|uniref:Ig-like domain-containing protein n=1 Tax=Flavobacterium kayseriense TaxID=2764714 RepID=A0ABR7J497_9FLAO|nr:Ig-like domain-containing protein [Flavobacterium kayseriense]MBC5840282.1 Ig-like domain-containing protein [Flavobacterium kayseriense]MBC5847048.1 Ig-like domain-containing protein [Flavobacterium kayseriense]